MSIAHYMYVGPYVEVPQEMYVDEYTDGQWAALVPGIAMPNITAFIDGLEIGDIRDFEGTIPLRSNLRDLALIETDAMVKEYQDIFERMTIDEITYRIQWGVVGYYL